jgi:hypothetical protein
MGCSKKVYYGSGDCNSRSASMTMIEKGIMQQYPQYIPNNVEVTDEFVKWITNETEGNYVTGFSKHVYEKTNIIYYNLIQSVELKKVQKHYKTIVITSSGGKFGFVYKDINTATQICQAFDCLSKK